MKKHSKTSHSDELKRNLQLIPILGTIGVLPLIVRLNFIDTPSTDIVWPTQASSDLVDLFVYSKGILLIIMALIGLIILLYNYKQTVQTLIPDKKLYLIYGYLGFVILSFIFSENHHLSLIGYHEHYENVFILIAYVLIFLLTIVVIKSKKQLYLVILVFSVTSCILFLIGIGQYFGFDFITSPIGIFLVKPKEYRNLNFSNDTDNIRNVYQTLYHYNYVSFFAAIGFPFFLVLGITEKKPKLKLLFLLITTFYGISQIISFSRNGYVGIIISTIVIIFIFSKAFLKHWKFLVPLSIMIIIGTLVFISQSSSFNAQRMRDGFTSIFVEDEVLINNIVTESNTLEIDHSDFYIKFIYEEAANQDTYLYLNKDNTSINLVEEDQSLYIEEIPAQIFHFQHGLLDNYPTLRININNIVWIFTVRDNNFYMLKPDQTYVSLENAPSIGFKGHETFASQRGYIWSRTLPLFSKYWLFGSGPDTYPIVFPQEDFIGKYNSYKTPYIIVDKPHNIFLNYGIHTGLISLLLLLIFWVMYILKSFKLYTFKPVTTLFTRVGIASFASTIGYLSAGLFNDTNLNVTPVFWIVLGLGYSANRLVSKSNQ